uniref:Ribonuclease H-like domain-containing protein n=1 Tax=Tanacetum cinerariifolium TaxID=118510 RepID=A0A6L2KF28_TANCI|nr:ribonuclease H-like domain-containing protein [Tanacetum cinerariifolium]
MLALIQKWIVAVCTLCWDVLNSQTPQSENAAMAKRILIALMSATREKIIMANVPPNDPNVDASAIVPAPVNLDHTPAQPIEEDAEEEEEDPEEEPKDDDDDMEIDDEAGVIDPYMDDGLKNPPPPNSEDEETPPTSLVIPDAEGQPIPPIASFGQNFHFGESSSTANLLTGNSKIVLTGPMCPNLGTAWKRLGKMEKFMSERINTEGRINKKFKEQDRHFIGLGCDNIEMDRTVRNVMSDLSGLKKLESKGSFLFPLGSQVREPPTEPSARPVPAPYSDDPYVVTRDAAIADAAITTSGVDDDDTAPMDSQPYDPHGSPRDTHFDHKKNNIQTSSFSSQSIQESLNNGKAASESSAKKKGRTVVIATKDMQKRRNDVKARTTLLLALPDEHQLRFSKYETAQELWGAILKTFGGNEATKKTKKNQLKQQYGNFKAEANTSSGKGEVHTASVSTASTQVSTASADVDATSISHDIVCAYVASQSNGSQIKYEDITQIDEYDIKEMDIKGRRESYKQGSKEEEPAPKALLAIDGIGWDWSYMANEEENHALVADDKALTEFALMAKSSSSSENEIKKEKQGLDSKLTGFESASKDLETLLGSQRTDKNEEGLGYNVVPPLLLKATHLPRKICLGLDCLNLQMILLLTIVGLPLV